MGCPHTDIANRSIAGISANPSLTVLTTVFNAERYLGQTINVSTQDFTFSI